jgi:subtilisin family serine protease
MKLLVKAMLLIVFVGCLFSQTIESEIVNWEGKEFHAKKDEWVFQLNNQNGIDILSESVKVDTSIKILKSIDKNYVGLIKCSSIDKINSLNRKSIFNFIVPNVIREGMITPNDTFTPLSFLYSSFFCAWDISRGRSDQMIGVLDTGIPLNSNLELYHEDLMTEKFILGLDFIDDGYGVKDQNGHGTKVAGVIGALTNNGKGVCASTWDTRLQISQVLDENKNGTSYDFYNGVIYSVDDGCKIINYSAGGSSPSPIDELAIEYALAEDVLIVTV